MESDKGAPLSIETLLEDQTFRDWVLRADDAATAQWNHYIEQHPERREQIEQARSLLRGMGEQFAANELTEQTVEHRLKDQLKTLGNPEKLGLPGRRRFFLLRKPRLLAAAAVLLLLVATFSWWQSQGRELVYTTGFAQWETLELPDGSTVKLNANSTLRLGRDLATTDLRRVWLSGEAYFQVRSKPESGSRFQVITDDLTLEVLGTAFNVHSRGAHTEVFLEEGSVSLDIETEGQREMMMEPGQKVSYSKAQRAVLTNEITTAEVATAWKTGLLKFDRTPMREVLTQVEEIYGIRFQVEDTSLYARPISSQGVPMEQLEVTLPLLARAMGVQIVLENDIYMIK